MNDFWTFNVGHAAVLVAIAGLFVSFWTAHQANIRRMEQNAGRLSKMESTLELIYDWFKENVIGRVGARRKDGTLD